MFLLMELETLVDTSCAADVLRAKRRRMAIDDVVVSACGV